MFGSLKKKLKQSVEKLTKRVEEKPDIVDKKSVLLAREEPKAGPEPVIDKDLGVEEIEPKELPKSVEQEEVTEEEFEERKKRGLELAEKEKPSKAEPKEKKGLFRRLTKKISHKEVSENDIDDFFSETETDLLEANIALEVVDFLREESKKALVGKPISRNAVKGKILEAFEESLFKILDQGDIDIVKFIKERKPATLIFFGFNGSGKTSSIAKIAYMLKAKGMRPLLAAGDTFRAASIEQLEVHGEKIGVSVVKHKYGADSAAVIFDARKHAEAKKFDVVLADTAGRMHTNRNLMDELEKVARVNKPDMKILVIDSLTGNDAVEQARQFNEKIGIDGVILTKVDVNEKGGSIFSVCYAIKKPVLFLGVGQGYGDLKKMEPREFVKGLFE